MSKRPKTPTGAKTPTVGRVSKEKRVWKDRPWATTQRETVMHVRLSSKEVLVNARTLAAKSDMTLSRWIDRLMREAIDKSWAPTLVHNFKPMTETPAEET